ncbi:MAG TPA: YkgJ family cysteine cluster protein [Dissulfurispiraceae bacterium]|nr:YkgJ family cysteine cluster protein [Dissulfurispiraceae bacterium]
MLNMKSVDPVRLSANAKFRFSCHKGIDCFTKCCSNIEIMLTPYDVVRLKNRMKLSSGEFLNDYTYVELEGKSSHPFVFLKMNEDKDRKCPFVSSEGCSIYDDRPANCRYYPVGQASLKKKDDNINDLITEEFYFFVREEHCLGFNEDKQWTIKQWRDDQGVDIYDEMNRGWKEILFRRNLPGNDLDEKKQKAFYMACYDIDRFRRFVFESPFLQHFDIDPVKVEKIRSDETELMKFGFDYTKFILGMEMTLKLRK